VLLTKSHLPDATADRDFGEAQDFSSNERPDIFNTDQGSHFTSEAFTGRLREGGIWISMDGKGRWRDIVFVERT